jgi:hypothetical protein
MIPEPCTTYPALIEWNLRALKFSVQVRIGEAPLIACHHEEK